MRIYILTCIRHAQPVRRLQIVLLVPNPRRTSNRSVFGVFPMFHFPPLYEAGGGPSHTSRNASSASAHSQGRPKSFGRGRTWRGVAVFRFEETRARASPKSPQDPFSSSPYRYSFGLLIFIRPPNGEAGSAAATRGAGAEVTALSPRSLRKRLIGSRVSSLSGL